MVAVYVESSPNRSNGASIPFLLSDRRVKIQFQMFSKSTRYWGPNKISASWIPRPPSLEQKLCRRRISEVKTSSLEIVTEDETWMHHWDPPTKQKSVQWVYKGPSPLKKAKTQSSAEEVMFPVFWDSKGIILIEHMPKLNVYKNN